MNTHLKRTIAAAGLTLGIVTTSTLESQRQPAAPLILGSVTGKDSFEFYCASCHGTTGRGDGPLVSRLTTRPTDLTSLARRNDGVFPRERVLASITGSGRQVEAHGTRDMPVWGPIFRGLDTSEPYSMQRIDNLVAFIETLQRPRATATGTDPGAGLFRTYCATCHGATGRGNGPLADRLREAPPDLTKFTERNGGLFPSERVYRIIDGRDVPSHGDREMPVWGDAFSSSREGATAESVKARIDAIVAYLRGIQARTAH